MTDTPAAAGTPLIQDEADRTALVVSNQRAYRIPLDVANELSACRAELAASQEQVLKLASSLIQCGQTARKSTLELMESERLLAAAAKDAERYRWLRRDEQECMDAFMRSGDDLDAAIDAALVSKESCEHDWIDPTNEVVRGGLYCPKCGAIKADTK